VLDDGTPVVIYPVMVAKGGMVMRRSILVCTSSANCARNDGRLTSQCLGETQSRCPTVLRRSTLAAGTLLTAYRCLFTKSRLKPGDTLLVQGASGGMSTALNRWGRLRGSSLGDTRNEEGAEIARRLWQMPCSRPTRHSPRG